MLLKQFQPGRSFWELSFQAKLNASHCPKIRQIFPNTGHIHKGLHYKKGTGLLSTRRNAHKSRKSVASDVSGRGILILKSV